MKTSLTNITKADKIISPIAITMGKVIYVASYIPGMSYIVMGTDAETLRKRVSGSIKIIQGNLKRDEKYVKQGIKLWTETRANRK